jgi:hypothetical protein
VIYVSSILRKILQKSVLKGPIPEGCQTDFSGSGCHNVKQQPLQGTAFSGIADTTILSVNDSATGSWKVSVLCIIFYVYAFLPSHYIHCLV